MLNWRYKEATLLYTWTKCIRDELTFVLPVAFADTPAKNSIGDGWKLLMKNMWYPWTDRKDKCHRYTLHMKMLSRFKLTTNHAYKLQDSKTNEPVPWKREYGHWNSHRDPWDEKSRDRWRRWKCLCLTCQLERPPRHRHRRHNHHRLGAADPPRMTHARLRPRLQRWTSWALGHSSWRARQ